ncbi:sulfur carrier protein ThiS [Salmonella enterica subsp. enterica]|nr:sulfur carrier protein ThiS [Salmonella enterica subsp. enterica]
MQIQFNDEPCSAPRANRQRALIQLNPAFKPGAALALNQRICHRAEQWRQQIVQEARPDPAFHVIAGG